MGLKHLKYAKLKCDMCKMVWIIYPDDLVGVEYIRLERSERDIHGDGDDGVIQGYNHQEKYIKTLCYDCWKKIEGKIEEMAKEE